MKSEGLKVNSLEEYQFNQVFVGRNWNAGDVVGMPKLIVCQYQFMTTSQNSSSEDQAANSIPSLSCCENFNLSSIPNSTHRRPSNVLCHELAHIKHMNHSKFFHKYNEDLRSQATALRQKGYFGDGYWSSGTRLADNATVQGQTALAAGDFADYICGGAQSRSKSSVWKPKKRKKPLTRKGMTIGAGNRVDGASLGLEKGQDPNSTYRKRATSKSARALRLEATEKRLAAMTKTKPENEDSGSTTEDELDFTETDTDRRQLMGDMKLEETGSAWDAFLGHDVEPFDTKQSTLDKIVDCKPKIKEEGFGSSSSSSSRNKKKHKEVIEID
ncbi:hypothetical protein J056_003348 [Wallemia ichthyophaga EXF-994]|uniref:WLM domain-containing protein n=1 Tax=Wallemia ichthyophaga (strain EXF-994 / CBS 113033) TaxID=1299270 RepID=R9ARV9_WALI9|nr:uncharacterized protein J056_003348 [Wallemia ichthyophaga EXF-994]EOR02786.1 hypothetical protein J056_003348 [Wallemia ichthyophaga EXF-994]